MYGIDSDADFLRFHQDNLGKLREINKDLESAYPLFQLFARRSAQKRLDEAVNKEASLFGIRYDLNGDVHSLARDAEVHAPNFISVLGAQNGGSAGI